jgi:O-acetyl-ADP-ribose deacetylase (regulator of RNase III)
MTAQVTIVQGDITKQEVDAIVNAANSTLAGGGGVDGAIHRAAGKELLEACLRIPHLSPGVRCPTGEARITPGFRLPARHVIHTVGPIYGRDPDPERSLRSALSSSLALAAQHGCRTVAVPAISCGAYGYPVEKAAAILIETAAAADGIDEVRFVLFDERTRDVFGHVVALAETRLRKS